jgi:hypothetical protein
MLCYPVARSSGWQHQAPQAIAHRRLSAEFRAARIAAVVQAGSMAGIGWQNISAQELIMTGPPTWLFVLGVAYVTLEFVAIHVWRWRLRRQGLPSLRANPNAWLASWLPQVIVAEVFALTGAPIAVLLALAFTAMSGFDRYYVDLGVGAGIVVGTAVCVVIDMLMVVGARQTARRQRADAHLHDAVSSP